MAEDPIPHLNFGEVVAQIEDLLRREKRLSYRGLKRRFAIDDEYLEDLKEELIGAKRVALDEEGRFLVWAVGQVEAERRQLTVMFCDLVGSTALSEQLDPEELRQVVRDYQETCTAAVRRYEGDVTQHLGDGLLIYFGYPSAHEDDAQRAVRASLDILPTVRSRCFVQLPGGAQPLQVRIGIHTGLVVIGEIGSAGKRENLALGEAPNVAARLQGLAEPDTIAISGATRALLTPGLFEFEDLGLQNLKGLSKPVAVHRVVREAEAGGRSGSSRHRGSPRLIGREPELESLRRCWRLAEQGLGQLVLLSGEAGLGKSRLIQALRNEVEGESAVAIEFRCSPYHRNSAFFPLIEHLQHAADIHRAEPGAARLVKLRRMLGPNRSPTDDTLALLASLLSLPHPEGAPALGLRPPQQKSRTIDAVIDVLLDDAQRQPTLFIWEDLHWADPSTLELLALLVQRGSNCRLLHVFSCRPEFRLPWPPPDSATRIALGRLERREVNAIVAQLTGGKPLPAELVSQIVNKTDGIPLFVEELTKMLIESDLCREVDGRYELTRPLPSFTIPSTIQDSLTARLDHLASVREIAQWAAVLGREFSYEIMAAVAPFEHARLAAGLRQLVEAELMDQIGVPPRADFSFAHALVRDAAYQSLLKVKRQQMHSKTAQVLEGEFPDTAIAQPELLAHHYGEAGLAKQAIGYWRQAGLKAAQRSAYVEAVTHLRAGLKLLDESPALQDRSAKELSLQAALGPVLIAAKGWGAPDTHAAYLRTRDLSAQLGKTDELFRALRGIVSAQVLEGKLGEAQALGEQLLSLAGHDPQRLLEAHNTLGITVAYLGEARRARAHLEQSVALHETRPPAPDGGRAPLTAQDPGVAGRAHLAVPLWILGYPDQALRRSEEALSMSLDLAHPFSIVYATCLKSIVHSFRREGALAHEMSSEVLRLSHEQGFSGWWLGNGLSVSGWAMTELGQHAVAADQLVQGVAAIRAAGTGLMLPYYLGQLGRAYGATQEPARGIEAVEEALQLMEQNEERLWEPELYRLKGELRLCIPDAQGQQKAEACFLKSLDLSRTREARAWELRAATSLARLRRMRGDTREAASILRGICDWFIEGQDTRDLRDAKALLAELD